MTEKKRHKRHKHIMNNGAFEKACRSSSYQWKVVEIPFDFTPPANQDQAHYQFGNDRSLSARLDPYAYNEQYLDLKDDLTDRFWKIAKDVLTPIQLNVVTMYASGKTQSEIAKELNRSQSSVNHNIYGSPRKTGITDGGALKKLKKAVLEDSIIQDIIQRMKELREGEEII